MALMGDADAAGVPVIACNDVMQCGNLCFYPSYCCPTGNKETSYTCPSGCSWNGVTCSCGTVEGLSDTSGTYTGTSCTTDYTGSTTKTCYKCVATKDETYGSCKQVAPN